MVLIVSLVISISLLLDSVISFHPNLLEHPSDEEVISCFSNVGYAFGIDGSVISTNPDGIASHLASKLPKKHFDVWCHDMPGIANSYKTHIDTMKNIDNNIDNEKRRLSSSCLNSANDFCDPFEFEYTDESGSTYYSTLVGILKNNDIISNSGSTPNREVYTDGGKVGALVTGQWAALLVLDVIDIACEIAVECTGSVQVAWIGNTISCVTAAVCKAVVEIAKAAITSMEWLLDLADTHDHVLMSSHLQAVFEDRSHIIHNQEYLDKQIDEHFTDQDDKLDVEFGEIDTLFSDQDDKLDLEFGEIDTHFSEQNDYLKERFDTIDKTLEEQREFLEAAFDHIDDRFDRMEELIIRSFDLQNEWHNIQYNDLFYQLNTLDKLIRTPPGQRPEYNEQTGLDDLFVNRTKVDDVPNINDGKAPTSDPTKSPTHEPTTHPTNQPSKVPTASPTQEPSTSPTTADPSRTPTDVPTHSPTPDPTNVPTPSPTNIPTETTAVPSPAPTGATVAGISMLVFISDSATQAPIPNLPTIAPADVPTKQPTTAPTESRLTLTQIDSINEAISSMQADGTVIEWDGTNTNNENNLKSLLNSNAYDILIGLNANTNGPIWSSKTGSFVTNALRIGLLDRLVVFDQYSGGNANIEGLSGMVQQFFSLNIHPINELERPSIGPDGAITSWQGGAAGFIKYDDLALDKQEKYYLNDQEKVILMDYCIDDGLIMYSTIGVDEYLGTITTVGDDDPRAVDGKIYFTNIVDLVLNEGKCEPTPSPTEDPTTANPTPAPVTPAPV